MKRRKWKSRRSMVVLIALAVAGAGGGISALVAATSASGTQWHQLNTSSTTSRAVAPTVPTIVQSFTAFAISQSANATIAGVKYVSVSDGAAVISAISGDSTNQDGPVIALEASGQFVANAAKTPEGAPTPTGTVLTEIVNSNTGAVEGWGVSNNTPNLSAYGTVQLGQQG